LNQSKLMPEEGLHFEKKQSLLRSTVESLINSANCEEYFLLYADGELNAEDRKAVEWFAEQNPLYKKELSLLQKVRLVPDEEILFGEKDKLYKKEGERRHVIYWLPRIAAAASVLVLLGLYVVLFKPGGQNQHNKPEISRKSTEKIENKSTSVTSRNDETLHNRTAKQADSNLENLRHDSGKEIVKNKKLVEQASDMKRKSSDETQENKAMAGVIVDGDLQKKGNNLKVVPNTSSISVTPIVPALVQSSTIHQTNPNPTKTDSALSQLAMIEKATNAEDVSIMSFSPKKNKMRGVFRRVTRVFEKTTNVDDEKRSLLIGSFQIALK
ncbi:MAG TPA: hypothetical protein VFV08_05780, partial [Puia sp.]|nr:hypothetical protein [Puia sp.]